MSIFKKILAFAIFIATLQASETGVFDLFKGSQDPFSEECAHSHNQIVKNLRLHGHFGPEDKEYPRPNWDGREKKKYPQDWTASLLEFLFPSYMGFLVDSLPSNPLHKLLHPKNCALVFVTMRLSGFYEDPIEGALKLARALEPDVNFKKIEADEAKRLLLQGKKQTQQPRFGAFSKLTSLSWPEKIPFADLLFMALKETNGDCATQLGYPQYVVERILLTYIWKKKKSKADLKPFYKVLSDHQIINKSIIGENDEFNSGDARDYYATREDRNIHEKQVKRSVQVKNNLEIETLLKSGDVNFFGLFPPCVGYGVSTVKLNGKDVSYSDCGGTSLFNFFMMILYDFNTKQFDWTLLEKLRERGLLIKENFIHFFRYICTSPVHADLQKTRNAWAFVLFNLNEGSDDNPVVYMKEKCCISPGLDNMLRVISKLLGFPKWGEGNFSTNTITNQLNFLCNIFTKSENLKWSWQVMDDVVQKYNYLYVGDSFCTELKNQKIKSYTDISIIFSLAQKEIFEWRFDAQHFDFNRFEHSKKSTCRVRLFNVSRIPKDLSENDFIDWFYSGNFDGINGKSEVLNNVLYYKKEYKKPTLDVWLKTLLEPSGAFFANWLDFHTNKIVLDIVLNYKTIKEVFNLKIPELSSQLFWNELSEGRLQNLRDILKWDIDLYRLEDSPVHNHQNDYNKMARLLAVTLEKASPTEAKTLFDLNVDYYLEIVSGVTLLQLAAYSRFPIFLILLKLYAPQIDNEIERRTLNGNRLIHFAAMCTNMHPIYEICKISSTFINDTNSQGDTPLHIAARAKNRGGVETLLKAGANIYAFNKMYEAPLQNVCDPFYGNMSLYEGDISAMMRCYNSYIDSQDK